MKKKFKIFVMMGFVLSLSPFCALAQVGINTDNSTPDPSAILDLKSASKGMLIPRMTQAQIQALSDPANGLQVYCTTDDKMYIYVAAAAKYKEVAYGAGTITPAPKTIGQAYGGGIIFYVDGTGQHGLISATMDQGTGNWGCWATSIGTSVVIGTGQANTTAIVNGCATAGIAARICDNLVLNGYSDWFLPSKDELNLMYLQRAVIGGFVNVYWSSSQSDVYSAWVQNLIVGVQGNMDKNYYVCYVRAVRAF